MREGAKRRLAGGAVIVVLAVVFLPMLFEGKPPASPELSGPPSEPDFDSHFPGRTPGASALDASATNDKTASAPAASLGGILDRDLQGDLGQPGQIRQGEPSRLGLVTEPSQTEPPERFGQPEMIPSPPSTPAPAARAQTSVTARPAPAKSPAPAIKPPQSTPRSAQSQKEPREREEPRKGREQKEQKEQKAAKEVATAPAEPRRPAGGGPSWVVQVASLGAAETAAQLEQKLRGAGFAAFVEKAEVRGKTYYRVRVGPKGDRASAERTAATLRQRQKLDTLIQRYP